MSMVVSLPERQPTMGRSTQVHGGREYRFSLAAFGSPPIRSYCPPPLYFVDVLLWYVVDKLVIESGEKLPAGAFISVISLPCLSHPYTQCDTTGILAYTGLIALWGKVSWTTCSHKSGALSTARKLPSRLVFHAAGIASCWSPDLVR